MTEIIDKQLDKQMGRFSERGYTLTPEFEELAQALREKGEGGHILKGILDDTGNYGFNIPLLKESSKILAANTPDEQKEAIMVQLYECYQNDIYSEYKDDILEIFLAFFEITKDITVIRNVTALAARLLNEDPCNEPVRERITRVIRQVIPTYGD